MTDPDSDIVLLGAELPEGAVDAFAPLVDRWEIANAFLEEITAWLPEYLAAYERQRDMRVGTTPLPRAYVVRHAGVVREGEQVPAIIVWPSGATDHAVEPDGTELGNLDLGVLIVAGARDAASTGDVLHRYLAALTALLNDRTTVGGHATGLELVDEDYEGIDATRERYLLSVALSYVATGVVLGHRHAGPPADATPRRDRTPHWPTSPLAATANVDVAIDPDDPEA